MTVLKDPGRPAVLAERGNLPPLLAVDRRTDGHFTGPLQRRRLTDCREEEAPLRAAAIVNGTFHLPQPLDGVIGAAQAVDMVDPVRRIRSEIDVRADEQELDGAGLLTASRHPLDRSMGRLWDHESRVA